MLLAKIQSIDGFRAVIGKGNRGIVGLAGFLGIDEVGFFGN